jgi:hydroxymethylpyrimidine kinase/phosphomethylpyrimidine kinase
VRVALSIAGSDPTGGAGLQADLQIFRALGVHGAAVVTALTVQDTGKVHQVLPVFPNVVLEQLRVLLDDVHPHAVKIGMLATDDVARNVELGLARLEAADPPRVPLVVDPVLAASDGTPLLERRAIASLEALIGRATLVTPNLPEAETLTGCDVSSREGTEAAGCALVSSLGAGAALVTGGHRDGPPDDLFVVRNGGSQTASRPPWCAVAASSLRRSKAPQTPASSPASSPTSRQDESASAEGARSEAEPSEGRSASDQRARGPAGCPAAYSARRTGTRRAPHSPGGPSKTPAQGVPQARQHPSSVRPHPVSSYQSRPMSSASQAWQRVL